MAKKVGFMLIFTLTTTMLFLVNSPSFGAVQPANQFRSSFHFTPEGSGFSFDRLLFPFNVSLTPDTGLHCRLEFGSSGVRALAYYYHKNLFQQDELAAGLLTLPWSAENSVTLAKSLSHKTLAAPSIGNTFVISDQPCGVGAKYTVDLGPATLAASLTNNPSWEPTNKPLDFNTRLSFQASKGMTVGTGLAARDIFSKNSNTGIIIDAAYTTANAGLLGEFVSWNLAGTDATKSGLYLEGFYNLTDQTQLYAGIFAANDLVHERLVLGGNHRVTANLTYQGELLTNKDDWQLTLQIQVQF